MDLDGGADEGDDGDSDDLDDMGGINDGVSQTAASLLSLTQFKGFDGYTDACRGVLRGQSIVQHTIIYYVTHMIINTKLQLPTAAYRYSLQLIPLDSARTGHLQLD